MTRRYDAQLEDAAELAAAGSVRNAAAPVLACTCEDFRRNQVCDHVLMAAAVRMLRRMIDIEKGHEKPH